MKAGDVFYSRYSDGCRPIRVLEKGFEIQDNKGEAQVYSTASSLLSELTGHPKGRHWTLERYLKIGKWQKPSQPSPNVLDLFGSTKPTIKPVTLKPLAPSLIYIQSDSTLTVPSGSSKAGSLGIALGIDLQNRAGEVRKLLFAGFGSRIYASGYDPEDVLQEVYKGLLARNKGKCPWDPNKSSFGHYVHMVCGCVLSNYHRKYNRINSIEQVGFKSLQEEGYIDCDVASASNLTDHQVQDADYLWNEVAEDLSEFIIVNNPADPITMLAVTLIPHISAGRRRADISKELGVTMAKLSRAVSLLRKSSKEWFRLHS